MHHSDVQIEKWPVILVATTNKGKLREIHEALAGLALTIRTLDDVAPMPEPEETGATFAENALIKAEAYATGSGLPTVAEDSGLAIDALGGRPGVHSARYPGDTYLDKFANLYRELAPHARPWTARFVCSLAFVAPDTSGRPTRLFAGEGTVEGRITDAPRGTGGFGYDPIFHVTAFDATLAEVDSTRKLAVSHRGAAFRAFRAWLETGVTT